MRHPTRPDRPKLAIAALLAGVVGLSPTGLTEGQTSGLDAASRQRGLDAFVEVAKVLRHPRCLNCHTATNFPRQGDDRHLHANLVRRGPDDHGAPGMRCSTCHQTENNASSGVPGKPNWHLAPLSMAWEGLSDSALCRTLKDRRRNGGRDLDALVKHISNDPLVSYGWDPGGRRAAIPAPRETMVEHMKAWVRSGAVCPD
jgi:hypothetical protein